jgi:hypothetical protein
MAQDVCIVDFATGLKIPADASSGGLLTSVKPLGYDKQYQVCAQTTTLAAALAANSCFFALRNSVTASPEQMLHIQQIRLSWTTIAAFTVPVTGGRRLELYRGTGAAAALGTAIPNAGKKISGAANSMADAVNGGDIRTAAGVSMTTAGITFETVPFAQMTLAHVGAAGAYFERIIDSFGPNDQPLELSAGELIAIRNPQAMDVGGTWQLGIEVDFYQG